MNSISNQTRSSWLGRWCQVVPLGLLSLPLLSSAQPFPTPTYSITENANETFTLSPALASEVIVALPNSPASSLGPAAHYVAWEFSGYSFSSTTAASQEPNPSDGINYVAPTFGPDTLVAVSEDTVDALSGFPSQISPSGDTGIVVYDANGKALGDVYFFDNVPDNTASTLSLSLMAVTALYGAVRFKLIPLASTECP